MSLDSFFDVQFPFSSNHSDFERDKSELFDNFEKNSVIKYVSANKNSEVVLDDKTVIFKKFPSKNEALDNWIFEVNNLGGFKSFNENFSENEIGKTLEFNSSDYFLDKRCRFGHKKLIFINSDGLKFRNKIVEEYSPLIPHLYQRGNFSSRGVSFQDFFQEGFIEISNVLNDYDISKGTKFFTFAYFCVRRAMFRKFNINSRIKTAANEFEERILNDGGVVESQEFVSDVQMDYETILGKLSFPEREVLKEYYGKGKTFREISNLFRKKENYNFGLNRNNLSKINSQAIEKLKRIYTF